MTKARQKQRKKGRVVAKAEAETARFGPKVTKLEFITSAEAGELLRKLLDPSTSH
jgi:hypothetical protein